MKQARFSVFKDKLRAYVNYFIIAVIMLVTYSLFRNITGSQEYVKTIEKRQNEAVALEQKNKELKEKLEKVSSEYFVESRIRDQLGLAKPGEIVLVLPEAEVLRSIVPKLPEEEVELPDPNWKMWVNLFIN